jgi:hypothetical protein
MGALVLWLSVGLLLALVLLAARTIDRRDRRRGHYLRSSGEMARDAWEHHRDAVAGDSTGHLNADHLGGRALRVPVAADSDGPSQTRAVTEDTR